MRIWVALLVAPLLALVDQSVAYSTVTWSCAHGHALAVHASHALFLAAIAAATLFAWQLWRETRAVRSRGEDLARRHFMAGIALASGALSGLVVIAMWIPAWVLAPCIA
jgi:hypothetical protein